MKKAAQKKNRAKLIRPNLYKEKRAAKKSGRRVGGGFFSGIWRAGKVLFSGIFALVVVGTLSIGLILGYHYTLSSPYFTMRKVVLNGLHRVSRAEVLNRTGLNCSSNILALKLGDMAEDLKGLAWIEDVTITRKLPDTIIVRIKERRPRALISLGSLYFLDESGLPFKKIENKDRPELPIITGFTRADFVERRRFVRRDMEEVFALLEILAERNDRFRLENISEINFDAARGLSLFTRKQNVKVKIGLGDYRAKLKRLGRVLAHLKINGQSDGLVYFNLECSPRVVVRRAVNSGGGGHV